MRVRGVESVKNNPANSHPIYKPRGSSWGIQEGLKSFANASPFQKRYTSREKDVLMKAGFRPALGWFGQTSVFEAHACVCVCSWVADKTHRIVDLKHCPEGAGYKSWSVTQKHISLFCVCILAGYPHTHWHMLDGLRQHTFTILPLPKWH